MNTTDMAYKVRCSHCGKSMRLPEGDAGLAVVCLACGTKFVAPASGDAAAAANGPPPADAAAAAGFGTTPPLAPAPLPAVERLDAPSARAPWAGAPSWESEAPPPAQRVEPVLVGPRAKSLRFPIGVVVALCAAVVVIAGVGMMVYRWAGGGQPSEQELARMLAEAGQLAQDGDLRAAHQKLRELDRRANEVGTDDPDVKAIADQARGEQERLFAVLLAQLPPAPATQPAVAAAAPTPAAPVATPPTNGGVPSDAAAADEPIDMSPAANGRDARAAAQPPSDDAAAAALAAGSSPPALAAPAVRSPTASAATTKPADGSPVPPAVAAPKRPPLQPVPEQVAGVTDEQIGLAIQRGVDHMIGLFSPTTGQLKSTSGAGDEAYAAGLNALCVYALLQSGQAIPDQRLNVRGPFMRSLIDGMKRMPANRGVVTYARGIRATALALYNRKEDRSALRADVQYLLLTHHEGAHAYAGGTGSSSGSAPARAARANPGSWDNSNSQYGLLGVWSGAETGGVEVPGDYWAAVQKHWNQHQNADGTWAYRTGSGTVSMTAAGTASLFVAEDYLYAGRFGTRVGREPFSPSLKRALDWWERDGNLSLAGTGWWGYTLYGIERVGLASGFKYFGKRDWYRDLAAMTIARQQPDGTWGDVVESAYALLFLARGRHPILMNKLRFDRGGATGEIQGFWGNRPRDAANLARYAGRQLERPLNWQVVTLDREWHDWLDSPILSIASHRAPFFTDAQHDKLRRYVEAGGMLFLQADGDSQEFNAFAEGFAPRLFPQYELRGLPAGHVLYNALYKVEPAPPLKAVSNGARVLILYAPQDLTRAWQVRDERGKENAFQFGVNLFVYAAGKRELRNRLSSPYVSPPPTPLPLGAVSVARLKYAGNWDPEPGAWRRFAHWFGRQTGSGLSYDTISLKSLPATGGPPFAHLTGTAPYQPNGEEVAALKAFVEAGGVVFIDSAGASGEFAESVKNALAAAFPEQTFSTLPNRHPLLADGPPGMEDLRKPRMRRFALERGGSADPKLEILRAGGGAIVVSDVDVTSGLLGTETWGVYGYEPAYAQSLMKNLVFWTIDGKPGT